MNAATLANWQRGIAATVFSVQTIPVYAGTLLAYILLVCKKEAV